MKILSKFAIATCLSVLPMTAFAGDAPSASPTDDIPVRMAHAHAEIYSGSYSGSSYQSPHKICQLEVNIPVYDRLTKSDGARKIEKFPECSVTINGKAKTLLIMSDLEMEKNVFGKPVKELSALVTIDGDMLLSAGTESEDLRSNSLNLSASFEIFKDPAAKTTELLLVVITAEDSAQ